MDFNYFIFPAPQSSYTIEQFISELVFIPRKNQLNKTDATLPIPCLYIPYPQGAQKLIIYFHGNAEDLGLAYELLEHMKNTMKMHVLAVEYPGYGIYPGKPTSEAILEDALTVWEYLTNDLKINPKDIILFGRSLGTGPAVELASFVQPCALLLMTAYMSIRSVVKNIAGTLASFLIYERFRSIDNIKEVQCPTFLIHGQKDTLIPSTDSQELHQACGGPSSLLLSNEMDHNEFDFYDDLSQPFYFFLLQCNINITYNGVDGGIGVNGMIVFPEEIKYVNDDRFRPKSQQSYWGKISGFLM